MDGIESTSHAIAPCWISNDSCNSNCMHFSVLFTLNENRNNNIVHTHQNAISGMRFIQAYVSMASQKKIILILIAEEIHLHYLCQMPEASPHNQIRLSIISIQFLISMRFARSCRLSIESLPMHFRFEFVHNFSRSNYVIGLHCVNVRSLHSFFIVNSQLTITHIQISTCNVSQREPTIVVLNMQ